MQVNDLCRGIGQLVTSLYNQLREANQTIESLRKGEGREVK